MMLAPLLLFAWLQAQPQIRPTSWLDQPLANWNKAGVLVPRAPAPAEPLRTVIGRCGLRPYDSAGAASVTAAGWIPFQYFGKPLEQADVEIIGGMTGADGMCRPTGYNVFVFVAQRYAGTLSPTPMTSRQDGSSGEIRLLLPEIAADFARYTERDPLCCPSARATVRFRIDRTKAGAVIVPIDIGARVESPGRLD
jgi:hypothetical protein